MRRHLACAAIALALIASSLSAQVHSTFQALTIANASVGLAAATLASGGRQMNYCVGRLETAQVRYRDDSTAPTATVGTVIEVGDVWEAWNNDTARVVRFIRTGAPSGVLSVHCYERRPW